METSQPSISFAATTAPHALVVASATPSRWWRLIGGVLMTLALGTLYAWSIFVAPLEQEFGWKRAQTSTVFTIAVVMFALSFVIAGRLQDRFGPFWIAITGGLLVSLGFFLCAYTTSLPYLYFCYGVLGGIGNGFGYATVVPVMSKWFPDKRGLAIGLALAGYGGGSAIFGPIADLQMFPHFGWRDTCMILGGIFLVMTMVASFLLKNPETITLPGWYTDWQVYSGTLFAHPGGCSSLSAKRDFAYANFLLDVVGFRARLVRGTYGDQPIGAVREEPGRSECRAGDDGFGGGGGGKCFGEGGLRLAFRRARAAQYVARDSGYFDDRDARALSRGSQCGCALRGRVRGLFLLWRRKLR